MGASYGGYAALAGVTVQHGLYRCAVSYAGISDLNAMLVWDAQRVGQVSTGMRYEHKYPGGHLHPRQRPARHFARCAWRTRPTPPSLLIHGKKDMTVPFIQSELMRTALTHAGKPVEMVELPSEDHYLSSQATRVQMVAASVAFVDLQQSAQLKRRRGRSLIPRASG